MLSARSLKTQQHARLSGTVCPTLQGPGSVDVLGRSGVADRSTDSRALELQELRHRREAPASAYP